MTEENIAAAMESIKASEEKNAFMTKEVQCEIVECAAALAKFSVWDLIGYVKNNKAE